MASSCRGNGWSYALGQDTHIYVTYLWVCCPVSCGPMVRVLVASLVSVALALVGASRTLDKCYDCNIHTV